MSTSSFRATTTTSASTSTAAAVAAPPPSNGAGMMASVWSCSDCSTVNPGHAAACMQCKALRLWTCPACSRASPVTSKVCLFCKAAKPSAWVCKDCSAVNHAERTVCMKCKKTNKRGPTSRSPPPSAQRPRLTLSAAPTPTASPAKVSTAAATETTPAPAAAAASSSSAAAAAAGSTAPWTSPTPLPIPSGFMTAAEAASAGVGDPSAQPGVDADGLPFDVALEATREVDQTFRPPVVTHTEEAAAAATSYQPAPLAPAGGDQVIPESAAVMDPVAFIERVMSKPMLSEDELKKLTPVQRNHTLLVEYSGLDDSDESWSKVLSSPNFDVRFESFLGSTIKKLYCTVGADRANVQFWTPAFSTCKGTRLGPGGNFSQSPESARDGMGEYPHHKIETAKYIVSGHLRRASAWDVDPSVTPDKDVDKISYMMSAFRAAICYREKQIISKILMLGAMGSNALNEAFDKTLSIALRPPFGALYQMQRLNNRRATKIEQAQTVLSLMWNEEIRHVFRGNEAGTKVKKAPEEGHFFQAECYAFMQKWKDSKTGKMEFPRATAKYAIEKDTTGNDMIAAVISKGYYPFAIPLFGPNGEEIDWNHAIRNEPLPVGTLVRMRNSFEFVEPDPIRNAYRNNDAGGGGGAGGGNVPKGKMLPGLKLALHAVQILSMDVAYVERPLSVLAIPGAAPLVPPKDAGPRVFGGSIENTKRLARHFLMYHGTDGYRVAGISGVQLAPVKPKAPAVPPTGAAALAAAAASSVAAPDTAAAAQANQQTPSAPRFDEADIPVM